MAVFSNALRKIAIKKEASWATGGTYTNFIDLTSLTVGDGGDIGSTPADNAGAFNGQEGATTCQLIGDAYKSAKLTASGHVNAKTFPFFLLSGVSADSVTETEAGVVYKHTFTGTRAIASLAGSIAIADNKGGEAFEATGLKTNTLDISWAGENNPVTFVANLIGKQISKDFDFATATSGASCSTIKHLIWSGASFSYGASPIGTVRNFSFNINNGLTEFRNGASTITEPNRTVIGGTGSMDIVFETDAWHALQSSQGLAELVLTTTGAETIGSGSNPNMILTIPKFRVLNVVSNDDKASLHVITVTFEALGDEASSGNAFTFSCQNLTASY